MSPRIVLQCIAKPLLIAGLAWGSSAVSNALAAPGQTPPPCSPDGACRPSPETFGWYKTRWRHWPGDHVGAAPTPAGPSEDQQEKDDRALGGPQEPDTAEESRVGPPKPAKSANQPDAAAPAQPPAAAPAAAPGVPPQPGAAPATPPVAGPENAQPPEAEPPAAQPGPNLGAPPPFGEPPAGDVTDPFSSAPRMRRAAPMASAPQRPAASAAQGPIDQSALNAPHSSDDDAPPALPPSLQRLSQKMPAPPAVAAAPVSLPPLAQPPSVIPATAPAVQPRIAQVAYQTATDAQLVNPAAAMVNQAAGSELEQAIYYEATDQTQEVLRY